MLGRPEENAGIGEGRFEPRDAEARPEMIAGPSPANRTRLPRLAMVMTVRNEALFLQANLLYHHALGVERAYVFLDRCTDGSDQIANSLPWVVPIQLDAVDADRFDLVSDLHRACMCRSLELARREGMDWLLTLDADEFAFGDDVDSSSGQSDLVLRRGDLRRLLAEAGDSTEMIRLRPKEVVTVDLGDDAPFWKQRYHQDSKPGGEVLTRELFDPLRGDVRHWRGLLGHPEGKSIVRTSARVQSYGSHSWVRYQGRTNSKCPSWIPLQTEELGFHYHFVITSQRHWQDKFRKLAHEPEEWPGGTPVCFPKQCWKRAASVLSELECRQYYAQWVTVPHERVRELVREGVVTEEGTVEQVLRCVGALRSDELGVPVTSARRAIQRWSVPGDFWRDDSTGATASQ